MTGVDGRINISFKRSPFARLSANSILTLLALLLPLLTSCIKEPEIRAAIPVELPARFSQSGDGLFAGEWWLDFEDAELTPLIEQALSDNFSLRIARDRLAAARASARQAGAPLSPSLDALTKIRATQDYDTGNTTDNLLFQLAASYEIDLWGRLAAIKDAAVLDAQVSQADLQSAAVSIAAEVAKAWYNIVETRLQQQLLKKQKETNDRVLQLITVQFRAGQAGAPDVLQQRQLVETNIAELAALRRTMQLSKNQLSLLLGETPGTSTFANPSLLPALPSLPDTGLPVAMLQRRPDVKSTFLQLQAADKRVAASVANRLPKLSISAELYSSGNLASNLFNNWFTSFLANLAGPILDGGQRKSEVEKRQAAARQLLSRYASTIQVAIGEVEDGLIRESEQVNIIQSLNVRLTLAAQTVDHVAVRYRRGAEDYQRVLLALLSHQGLQRNVLKARLQLINYRIGLYRALGGYPLRAE